MFKKLPTKVHYPDLETEILTFWKENRIFERSVQERPEDKPFIFYEGPPTANGAPGVHHVISRTIKDLICRYKTMQGFRVERKAGWDTHGLPVEIEVEKALNLDTKEKIIDYGVDKFNKQCRESVWKYKQEWDSLTERIGYWIDLDDPYITYTNNYIESVWWILDNLFKRDLIYKGHKILPYCPRCGTPLSSHEVSLGYRDVTDPSIYVKAKIKGEDDTYLLLWTTTPWTLLSNVALAVNPYCTYVYAKIGDHTLILVEDRKDILPDGHEIIKTCKGSDLVDKEYEKIFPFMKADKKAYYIISGEFVTTEEGTGIVHIAPAFGEDDYQMGLKYDLPVFQPVDDKGNFTEEITPYKGLFVKDADPKIIADLQESGALLKSVDYKHSYPHCWRCDTPLLYYARQSWFIKTTQFRDQLLENNDKVRWVPKEVGEKRFHRWLENNIDWSLSRDRFWGTPLNIWICSGCGSMESVGSVETLKSRSHNPLQEPLDLHKPYIDDVTMACGKCSGTMERTPEVIDAWFDSGSMPFAQWHYPFENKEKFNLHYPSDFISEAVDQTRGWFYSLLAISVLLNNKPAYKSCLTMDMILDAEGVKMSKSKGNVVRPNDVLESEGADALRWYLISSSPPWIPTRFDREGIQEVIKKFFGTLVNTYSFFVTYANIDEFAYSDDLPIPMQDRSEIDRWLLSSLARVVEKSNSLMDNYEITKAARLISEFVIDDLSNWYVRLNRRRFWKSDKGPDKNAAYQTLYETLISISRLMAPIAPFLSEEIYRNLKASDGSPDVSVHLQPYPLIDESIFIGRDNDLADRMDQIRRVCILARSVRSKSGIKIRQPLSELVVIPNDKQQQKHIEQGRNLILSELNIKLLSFSSDDSGLMKKVARPNFKTLGPKLGRDIQLAKTVLAELPQDEIERYEGGNEITIKINRDAYTLENNDLEIVTEQIPEMAVVEGNGLTVGINTNLTPELLREGFAREFINRVQNMRKEANFEVVDRIRLFLDAEDSIREIVMKEESYISEETLTTEIVTSFQPGEFERTFEFDTGTARVGIERITNSS